MTALPIRPPRAPGSETRIALALPLADGSDWQVDFPASCAVFIGAYPRLKEFRRCGPIFTFQLCES